jgi:signal transduction histidine kinase
MAQVIHLNRSAEVGALSASFAHELSQPLVAIMMNVDSAEHLLAGNPPKVCGLRSILAETLGAAQHATEFIRNLGKLLKRESEAEREEFDLAQVLAHAVDILTPESTKRGISLQAKGVRSHCRCGPIVSTCCK